jgi:hypothetical protein
MATGFGFSKTVTDGLIFGYDTGDQRNLYRGQPGTNIAYGPNRNYDGYSITNYSNGKLFETNGYTETVDIPLLGRTSVQTIEIYNVYSGYGTDGNFNCCPNLLNYSPSGWNSTTWESSTTYTYQIIYKTTSGYTHPNYMYHYEYAANGTYLTEYGVHDTSRREELGNGWYHAWGTFTTQAGAATGFLGFWHYEYNTRNKVSVAAISLVKGSTIRPPLQFINEGTTLSVSGSLVDCKQTYNLNITNSSFTSTGALTFDGTNDFISTNIPDVNLNGGSWTIEAVVSFNALSKGPDNAIFGHGAASGRNGLHLGERSSKVYFGFYGDDLAGNATFVTGRYYHICWVYNHSTAEKIIYVNGAFDNSATQNTYLGTGNNFEIGRYPWSTGNVMSGDIPVVKMYNRVLTAGEARQNYNLYRTRFSMG